MDRSDQYLDQLDEKLSALPQDGYPMTVAELDGFVTGLLCSPERPAPEAWLAQVWGETEGSPFEDAAEEAATTEAVLKHYDMVAELLAETAWVQPIYEMDPDTNEILWQPWIDGFTRALRLQPDLWQKILDDYADEDGTAALVFLMGLQDVAEGESRFSEEETAQIEAEAPDMIPECIADLLSLTHPELVQEDDEDEV